MRREVGEEIASRRAEIERSGCHKDVPIRHTNAELKRDDHRDEEENEFFLGKEIGLISSEEEENDPDGGDCFYRPENIGEMIDDEIIVPPKRSPVRARRERESSRRETLLEVVAERGYCFNGGSFEGKKFRERVPCFEKRIGDQKKSDEEDAGNKEFLRVFGFFEEVKSDESQENHEEDNRGSFCENTNRGCEYHKGNILPIRSVAKAQDAAPGKEKEKGNEKRIVVDIGRIHRKFRLEGDECRKKRTRESIEFECASDEEREEDGKCPEKYRKNSNRIESNENVFFGERRLYFRGECVVETPANDIRMFEEIVGAPFSLEDFSFVFSFGSIGEVRRVGESASNIIDSRGCTGIQNFFGKVVVGECIAIHFGFFVVLSPFFVRWLIDELYGIVVSRFVLPGKYREKGCQKHAFEEKGGEEERNEEHGVAENFLKKPHRESIL